MNLNMYGFSSSWNICTYYYRIDCSSYCGFSSGLDSAFEQMLAGAWMEAKEEEIMVLDYLND